MITLTLHKPFISFSFFAALYGFCTPLGYLDIIHVCILYIQTRQVTLTHQALMTEVREVASREQEIW